MQWIRTNKHNSEETAMGNWNRRDFLQDTGLILGSMALPLDVLAAAYPGRPVTAFGATPVGGGVDKVARSLTPLMEPLLGNATINNVNKPGATGTVAGAYVLSQPADGYSWLFTGSFMRGTRAMGLTASVPYKDWQYFGADTSIASIAVLPDSPIKDMEDLIRRAKDGPGKLRMATDGLGGTWFLAASLMMQLSGTNFRLVPYNDGGAAQTGALKGEVEVTLNGVHEQLELLKAGRLRNLCVFTDKALDIQGQHLKTVVDFVPKLKGKTPVGGGVAMSLRRDTDPGILRDISKAWLGAVSSQKFHEIESKKSRFPAPVVGADADRRATLWEVTAANLLASVGKAKKSPKDLGLPSIDEFDNWWPPKGYKARI
jgi:tripartite-type tricarboxylate transporter receptor subunit TctC